MPPLAEVRFRSSPHIELQPLAALSDGQREQLRELESEYYGVLVAKPPLAMTVKSVARPVAELFQSLATPSRLDRALLDDDVVLDLVLDGILEVESDDGFVSGADALSLVGLDACDAGDGGGELARAALRHAQELQTRDPQALAIALYNYNRIPITPFWRARFAGPEAVLGHVGADRGALRALLERHWSFSTAMEGWLSWTAHDAPRSECDDRVTYKLYVSPRPERIRDAFEALVRVLAMAPATFKMGRDAAGLLRPDKLAAYFDTREELDDAAASMRRALAGCDAHGVPFTAAISPLLSWAIDPPENERVLHWLDRQSWRFWIVQRLGGAMAVAKAARTAKAIEPWRFALARVARLGVDVATWTPSPSLWSAA